MADPLRVCDGCLTPLHHDAMELGIDSLLAFRHPLAEPCWWCSAPATLLLMAPRPPQNNSAGPRRTRR